MSVFVDVGADHPGTRFFESYMQMEYEEVYPITSVEAFISADGRSTSTRQQQHQQQR